MEVDQNDSAFIYNGDEDEELVTYGVRPCIAIAVLNRTKAWAGLFHYDNVHHKTPEIQGFLSDAQHACEPDDQVEVSYGGGDDSDPVTTEEVRRARAAAEEAVRAFFPRARPPQWLNGDGAYNVILTTNPPRASFEFVRDDEP
ncbi:hypothetical protein [Methylorubrum populi]|uniref:hypothetical protein n=1 Tax=Methylorubrum TaxID=2282523 RepID=UPI00115311D2|nr:hypothetical protein [Methylorubrum populi]QDI82385.1 hypothetical protein E8E01_19170 [Methylorubrum populi]